jgi:isocitrate dehydrogenase
MKYVVFSLFSPLFLPGFVCFLGWFHAVNVCVPRLFVTKSSPLKLHRGRHSNVALAAAALTLEELVATKVITQEVYERQKEREREREEKQLEREREEKQLEREREEKQKKIVLLAHRLTDPMLDQKVREKYQAMLDALQFGSFE